jgi:hypothetical protein
MPTQPPVHRTPLHQLPLPWDLPQPWGALPHALHLVWVTPQEVWHTLTDEQQGNLRQQLIQILQEALRHAKQPREDHVRAP